MRNLTTLTNVKTLSNKFASKIKGGDNTPVIDKIYTNSIPVIDKLTTVEYTNNNYTVTLK